MLEKINFVNGQQPAINDVNLNKMQDNIEEYVEEYIDNLKTYILYDSESGTQSNFDLIDDISNYEYVEIIGKRGEQVQCSTKAIVNQTGNTPVSLVSTYYGYGDNMWIDQLGLTMSGTTATINNYSSLNGATGSLKVENVLNIKVLRVVGYKEV